MAPEKPSGGLPPRAYDHRRRERRSSVVVAVCERRGDQTIEHWSGDLSRTGVFLCYTMPYPVGQTIDLELRLPGLPDPVDVRGRVMNFQDKYGTFGVGVEFIDLPQDTRQTIEDFLAQQERDAILSS